MTAKAKQFTEPDAPPVFRRLAEELGSPPLRYRPRSFERIRREAERGRPKPGAKEVD